MEDKTNPLYVIVIPFLKGFGQIMLQDNPWTGLFFMVGIFFGSLAMGIAAILAVMTGTFTAILLRYDAAEINSGIYGFSAALVGVALTIIFRPTMIIWSAVVVGSVLAAIIQHLFIVKKIPAYTFPFILVTWLFLAIAPYFPSLAPPAVMSGTVIHTPLSTLPLAFGQVIFQSSLWAGVLFIIGVLVSRPLTAIYALVAATLCGLIAYRLGEPTKDIYLGLLSYNAVLCAIVFAGKKWVDLGMAFISVLFSVLIMIQMRRMNLAALTFPFVLATWIVVLLKMAMQKYHIQRNS